MLKQESEDGKSRNQDSSPWWLSCICMTLLVMSITLSVAALWIPWERLNKVNEEMRLLKENYLQIEEILNNNTKFINQEPFDDNHNAKLPNTKSFVSDDKSDLIQMFTEDLQQIFGEKERKLEDLIEGLTKRLHGNEMDIDYLLKNQTVLEDKVINVQELITAKEREGQWEKTETGNFLRSLKDVTNRINHLEAQTNRLYAEVEGNKEELITVWDRLDGVEQSLEGLDVDEDAITENIQRMVVENINQMQDKTVEWMTSFESNTSQHLLGQQKLLENTIRDLSENVDAKTAQISAEVDNQLSKLSTFEQRITDKSSKLVERFDNIDAAMGNLTVSAELGSTVSKLSKSVGVLTEKMNQYIQNVLIIKSLPQIVAGLEKRIEALDKRNKVKSN